MLSLPLPLPLTLFLPLSLTLTLTLTQAMACYRSAIRIDERHYNAWYALGNIYYPPPSPKTLAPSP